MSALNILVSIVNPNATLAASGGAYTTTLARPVVLAKQPQLGRHETKGVFVSSFAAALAIFILVDLFVRFNLHTDVYQLPERTFIWWAVRDYRQLKKAPDVMLFGSSLMLSVIDNGDATYLNQPVDTVLHHRSQCIEDKLSQAFGKKLNTFSFAIGGEMASDVFAISSVFIKKPQNQPKMIVWGIAPRDIVDSTFAGVSTSDAARYMNKIAGCDFMPNEHKSFPYYIEQTLKCISAIFHGRTDLQSESSRFVKHCLTTFLGAQNIQCTQKPQIVSELMKSHRGNVGDIDQGEWVISPCLSPSKQLYDNAAEYRARYNPFQAKKFQCQLAYMEKFLARQKQLGVALALVNMPLTEQNMALMPEGTYKAYLSAVRQLAKKYSAKFYDFNDGRQFSVKDFFDTAHLNGLGGEKLAGYIATKLAAELKAAN